jgi:hypothetical protein
MKDELKPSSVLETISKHSMKGKMRSVQVSKPNGSFEIVAAGGFQNLALVTYVSKSKRAASVILFLL